ncbi:hypothetical protein CALCODRAFT_115020 [Calocera cornea HHB12733]|uniref:Uncharacterized protein n=1 Tax=Calocera cornea HHB12733 TaxID=1353952 RepID=A0A165IBY7_9BASI|nr:hypothetical protein CALCODRAFT_115020 [Calocera cornea HHB12733]
MLRPGLAVFLRLACRPECADWNALPMTQHLPCWLRRRPTPPPRLMVPCICRARSSRTFGCELGWGRMCRRLASRMAGLSTRSLTGTGQATLLECTSLYSPRPLMALSALLPPTVVPS